MTATILLSVDASAEIVLLVLWLSLVVLAVSFYVIRDRS